MYINTIRFINMTNMPNEKWKPIPGFEGIYSVSSFGRVKREQSLVQEKGRNESWKPKFYTVPERILKASIQTIGKGYHRVSLSKNSKITYAFVHRLVAWAFIGVQENGVEVRHIDGDSRNNRLDNLCYGTKSDNMQDAIKHGTLPRWEDRPGAKLNRFKAIEICKRGVAGESAINIASYFGIGTCAVYDIWRGKTWAEFTVNIRPNRRIEKFSQLNEDQIKILLNKTINGTKAANILNVKRHSIYKWRRKLIASQ